ncbi:putative transcriptional regulator, Crp/Fnr family [Fibrisoma limi BUZ 3]|uniref:Putative transcriptional regulator, Crp/Fnr family n=1 Tax=Fibrisoma limi BUZ 3 TaxID=1185876 RepID=I2GQ88_9BACT|nr:Crp/Fnr family transcriptional regulator [Fibrisoma limi]CCH56066.1 putative transcriptional regulator, Crp/Fnr family [Fibrisoma limi BUZ 3]
MQVFDTAAAHERILSHVQQLISLTEEEETYFLSILKPRVLRRRQYLVQQGEVCRFENFVVKGTLRAFAIDPKGQEHNVLFALEDWWISDFQSLLTEQPATLYVEAIEEAHLLQIEKKDIEQLFINVPKFERFFLVKLQKAFIAFQNRIFSTISQTAEERYLDFRQRYPLIEQRVPQYMLASYLGITPEFLSKIRRELATRH